MGFTASDDFIAESNGAGKDALKEDCAPLGRQLARRGLDLERLTERALQGQVNQDLYEPASITSAVEVVRACVQAHLVDREALREHQEKKDPLMALQTLKKPFTTDVSPVLSMARHRAGGAVVPMATYRHSGYRQKKTPERPDRGSGAAGIVGGRP